MYNTQKQLQKFYKLQSIVVQQSSKYKSMIIVRFHAYSIVVF